MDNGFNIRNGINLGPQPSQPANGKNGDIYYDNALGFRVYANGSWGPLNSSTNTTNKINFITQSSSYLATQLNNYNLEESLGEWLAYADAAGTQPVDMFGGSPTVTATRTTTPGEILDGVASLKIVKDAANRQGQGAACIANVPMAYRGQIASIQIPFKVLSGSIVQGDLKVYIYDLDNATVFAPNNNDILGTQSVLRATVPIQSNTTQLRIGFHFSSPSTTAVTIAFDDIYIGPQEIVMGPAMSDWTEDSAPWSMAGVGTISNVSIKTKQVGDSLHVKGQLTLGTVAASLAYIQLPPGINVDFSKETNPTLFTQVGTINQNFSGTNTRYNNGGSGANTAMALFVDGVSSDKIYIAWRDIGGQYAAENGNSLFTSGSYVDFVFEIPVIGLSSNVVSQNATTFQLSNYVAAGTRVVGTPPTQLGEYRSYLRNANAQTYTETNGDPQDLPTATDGIRIYTSSLYALGDPNNQPSKYELFIGKNKQYTSQYSQNAGRSGPIDVKPQTISTTYDSGVREAYDPSTGILTIAQNTLAGFTNLVTGQNPESSVSYFSAYFDIFVSEKVIPVQIETNNSAPAMTDWKSDLAFDPNGGLSGVDTFFYYRRVGDSMQVRGYFVVTTSSGSTAKITLPSGFLIDASKFTSDANVQMVGNYYLNRSVPTGYGTSNFFGNIFFDGTDLTSLYFAYQGDVNIMSKANGNDISSGVGGSTVIEFTIPIQNWSSNVTQQDAVMFNISDYLAFGTRVVGTPPTALGEYRSYLRIANTGTYTETNGDPADAPSIANGIHIWTANPYSSGDANNNPSRYEIFIGKDKQFNFEGYQTTGRTGFIDMDPMTSGSNNYGLIKSYDPTTGILSLSQLWFSGGGLGVGIDAIGSVSYSDAYFDIAVSDSIIPVQFDINRLVPSISDPIQYDPTFVGIGTPTALKIFQYQEGKFLNVYGSFTSGSASATPFSISLPVGLAIDTNVLDTVAQVCGEVSTEATGTAGVPEIAMLMVQPGTSNTLVYACNVNNGGSGNLVALNANFLFNNSTKYSFWFKIPIRSWSANNLQQNATMFNISEYLVFGTQVTGAPPTKLGEYRSMIRNGASTTSAVDDTPSSPPTVSNGVKIYASAYNSSPTAGQTQRYEIFVGKNKKIDWNFFANTGKSGYLSVDCHHSGGATVERVKGAQIGYDPTTGVAYIDTLWTDDGNDTIHELGDTFSGAGGVSAVTVGYFDIGVSNSIVPVQLQTNPIQISGSSGGFATGGTADATNLTLDVNCTDGRPVELWLQHDGSGNSSHFGSNLASGSFSAAYCAIYRNGDLISMQDVYLATTPAGSYSDTPVSAIRHVDANPPLGINTYKVTAIASGSTLQLYYAVLCAWRR